MKAVVIHETGGPDVLRLEEIDRPEPGDGEVLIRVHAASVNPMDWKFRRGLVDTSMPKVLGADVSGTVETSRADGFSEGDQVFGMSSSGAYAEYSTASAEVIAKKPDGVTHTEAAGIPVAGLTAWQALFDRGGLQGGQTALVAGAAGGVGHFAVQFAKVAGGRAIGTGSARNRDFVLGLGADEYVDYTQEEVGEAVTGADVAIDTVGGDTTASLVPAVREGGILVTIASAPPEEAARERGVRAELLIMSPQTEQLARIAERVAGGEVRVEIAEAMPLADVKRAHELSESGHVRGKLVLTLTA
jgi:NADPH:quinone reductase-like Zn-dependent oxidoreductase